MAELWETIRAGRSGITRFTDAELRAAGVPAGLLADPAYVKAGAVISDIDQFDAGFFGISPKEAQVLDPQQRLFLEHSWMALEDAGCVPARFDGSIGVFAGSAWSSYLTSNLTPAGAARDVGELTVALGNEKDCLPLRAAHLLGLSGPAFGVQSNCSTSLVAVCAAASSLAGFECDAALAGGVAISVPHRVGYLYQPGGIAPPDGRCRAFDAAGLGAPLGSGVGVVVLRRLADALADGDRVYAVLRGWAVNNDGGRKVGFTAPGVDGQASVIAEALAAAGLEPADIDYVEAHGTGTMLGDAAELAALQRVFAGEAVRIGSVKTNIGHLDRAAGVTGLIKAALALHHGEIPATLNLTEPNPQLADGDADLTVVTERHDWPRGPRPRRAGVSAFGIGGTNAHVVIEEAPRRARVPLRDSPVPDDAASDSPELLAWSARTAAAADEATARLAGHLERVPVPLADVAATLQHGRDVFAHRRVLVAGTAGEAATALRQGAAFSHADGRTDRPVSFLISGPGDRYAAMAADLYDREPVFREELDRCRDLLAATGPARRGAASRGTPGRRRLASSPSGTPWPALALSWTGEPAMIAGEGRGEYVAACLAGVLSLEDALALAARHAELPGPELADWIAARLTLGTPAIPLVSAATGLVLTPGQAADPAHWAAPATALSPAALATLLADDQNALLELGPGVITADAAAHPDCPPARRALLMAALPATARPATASGEPRLAAGDPGSVASALAEAAGRLWLVGVPVDWAAFRAGRPGGRTSLPTYPFQRQRYWIDPPAPAQAATMIVTDYPAETRKNGHDHGRAPGASPGGGADGHVQLLAQHWEPADADAPSTLAPGRYVIVPDAGGVGVALAGLLRQAGADVVTAADGDALAAALAAPSSSAGPTIVCLSALDEDDATKAVLSVARLLAVSAADGTGAARVLVATRGGQPVTDAEPVRAAQAAVTVLPVIASQEYLNLDSASIDLDPGYGPDQAAAALAAEAGQPGDPVVAYRAGRGSRPATPRPGLSLANPAPRQRPAPPTSAPDPPPPDPPPPRPRRRCAPAPSQFRPSPLRSSPRQRCGRAAAT